MLSAIARFGTAGLVIAGSVAAPDSDCPSRREPRLWSSSDGLSWHEVRIDERGNATADLLPADGEGGLVIGSTGSSSCPGTGPVAWKSVDEAEFRQWPTDGLGDGDTVLDLVALDGDLEFVAAGYLAGSSDTMGIWRVQLDTMGSHWQPVAGPPDKSASRSTLSSLASDGEVVVGFDVWREPHAWYSLDAGHNWASADFSASHGLLVTDSDFGHAEFLAAGRACCGLPDQQFGSAVRSTDGRTWSEARPETDFGQPIEALVETATGWIALGEETYLSTDGSDWHLGPPLPGYVPEAYLVNGVPVPFRVRAESVAGTVVAMTPGAVWHATLDDLVASDWPAAPAAVMPSVGDTYAYTLLTHCGPTSRTLNFDRRSWLPDIPEGYFPLSFDYYYEHGTLAYVAADRLEFTGSKGDVVPFVPTGGPPTSSLCH